MITICLTKQRKVKLEGDRREGKEREEHVMLCVNL
jgi:hypothetical protein